MPNLVIITQFHKIVKLHYAHTCTCTCMYVHVEKYIVHIHCTSTSLKFPTIDSTLIVLYMWTPKRPDYSFILVCTIVHVNAYYCR